ncbi:MAG TPA: hypothetical protein VGR90_01495, partial [Acidimicrobiales bacterium]|nr:hypothetical protein [Acidimicrobiales bacterium]
MAIATKDAVDRPRASGAQQASAPVTARDADRRDVAVGTSFPDLDVLDGQVTRLFALVADGIVAATRTFLESDREGAWLVVAA